MTVSQDRTGNVDFSDIKKGLQSVIDALKNLEKKSDDDEDLFTRISKVANCGKDHL
ncbi:hypothetical protein GF325_12390 [Candidatus Bathyarchaeota archaeon]|nr:hypothetical protein [Candidatus Bathyarchaeota archaeon]